MFLGVGAQKSGTTWLSRYLADHPDVYMSALKEMHFWGNRTSSAKWPNSAFEKRIARLRANGSTSLSTFNLISALQDRLAMQGDLEKYTAYFEDRVEDHAAFGEISPAYCKLQRDELALIKAQYPDVKIIYLMRNPADRLWSQIRFSEEAETLEEMEQKIDGSFDKQVYQDRLDYVNTIQNLQATFAPENLHFEFFEHLFTQDAVDKICAFLGVAPHAGEFSKKRNVSIKMPLQPKLRADMVARLEPHYTFVRDMFAGEIPLSWQRDLTELRNTGSPD